MIILPELFARAHDTAGDPLLLGGLQNLTGKYTQAQLESLQQSYFGRLMQRANSLEKTLMLGRVEGKRRKG